MQRLTQKKDKNAMTAFSQADENFMREALALAKQGEGRVAPNPPVGCVLVKNGHIIATGWHDKLGDLHAEAMALRNAGAEAKDCTAYITLSPCTTHGKQPPCSDALIRAQIAEAIVAAPDPNPQNADGVHALMQAGIPARSGLLREEAEYLARGFMKMQRSRLPWLTLKYAMTLDGKIAAASGDSRWVSGTESRELVQDMRSRADAILVGSGTAFADNPLLTVRPPALAARGGPDKHPQPLRVVADSRCRLSAEAAMLDPAQGPGGNVVVFCLEQHDEENAARLRRAGADVVPLPAAPGKIPLEKMLSELGRRGVNTVLCEGGGELAASLVADGLADEVAVFIAPKLVGGRDAPGPVGGAGAPRMAEAWPVAQGEWRRVGDDMLVTGLLREKKLAPLSPDSLY